MAFPPKITAAELMGELLFTTSRSSGPGGQNVNKVNSKVTLRLDIPNSAVLSDEQKELILIKLSNQLTKEGVLLITSQESRSQGENRELAIGKLDELLTRIFTRIKKRKPTRPGKAAKQKRLTGKKQHSEKKAWRKKPL